MQNNFKEENAKKRLEIINWIESLENLLETKFKEIDKIAEHNQIKILKAMKKLNISERHFYPSTGYGYGDDSRDKLALLYAEVFGSEDALVRPHWSSGTHIISDALYSVLRPGDYLLAITGKPYDTLSETISGNDSDDNKGSFSDWNIHYDEVNLNKLGQIDVDEVLLKLGENPKIKALFIQRSKGYEWRKAIGVSEIEKVIKRIKDKYPDKIFIVDNCYGEFTERLEPTEVGVDLVIGSLIKNPGGGLAPTGGYAVGRSKMIELLSYRLTTPAVGREIGSYATTYIPFYQGLFLAPHVVGQALKGAVLFSKAFYRLGYEVLPKWRDDRSDIVQCIKLETEDSLITFCQEIQASSPIDGHVLPYPWDMPGYNHEIIMAAGTFIQGSTIELSADGPLKEPYIGYLQGGLTYSHIKYALTNILLKKPYNANNFT